MKGEILTRREVSALLTACRPRNPTGARNAALLAVLYRGGLRISEAIALRRVDVDVDQAELRIRNGKGGKGRVVPVDAACIAVVQRWLEHRAAVPVHQRYGPVFCTLRGVAIASAYVRELLPRLAERAELGRRVHAHAFRHTYAHELAREGVDAIAISRLLGHARVDTTIAYLRQIVAPAELRKVARARPSWA